MTLSRDRNVPAAGPAPSAGGGSSEEPLELDLREVVRVLGRRRRLLVWCTLGTLALCLASAFVQSPVYESTAKILFERRISETLFDTGNAQSPDPGRIQQTEIQVLGSQAVADKVRAKIGIAPGVTGRPLAGTDVIEISARNHDRRRAAQIADAYADAYIEFRRGQAVDDLLAAADQIQQKINDIQKQMSGATGAVLSSLTAQQQAYRQKLDQVQVDAALKSGGAVKVAPASVPKGPIEPQPVRRAAVGAVFGLLGGIGLVFLLDQLDDGIKTKDDLEKATGGLQVLGLIPRIDEWRSTGEPYVASLSDPTSPVAEAYRTLRTSLQFLALDGPVRVIQVTSARAGEGKTTTVANLAVALARAGERVVVVCCDLRRPRVHEFFGLDNEIGFSSVLLGTTALRSALQTVTDHRGVQLLASGPEPPNPSEILATRRAGELIGVLKDQGVVVLIDSPPVLPVTDSHVLSKWVDAVVVVTLAGTTTKEDVSRCLELLNRVGAGVVGTVLNGAGSDSDSSYAYGYGYSRQAEKAGGRRRSGRTRRSDRDGA